MIFLMMSLSSSCWPFDATEEIARQRRFVDDVDGQNRFIIDYTVLQNGNVFKKFELHQGLDGAGYFYSRNRDFVAFPQAAMDLMALRSRLTALDVDTSISYSLRSPGQDFHTLWLGRDILNQHWIRQAEI